MFGGQADGRRVRVQFLDQPVGVWREIDGTLTALAADAPRRHGEFLGFYEFVGPRGPERPVLVHRQRRQLQLSG